MDSSVTSGGPVENWLAIIGVISLMYWTWRISAAFVGHRRGKEGAVLPAPASTTGQLSAAAAPAVYESDIAVIAAAVYAVLGAHRILHVQPERQGRIWAAEGRWMQQTSHNIRRP